MTSRKGHPPRARVENCIPILSVSDLERSIRYYVDALGFAVDWRAPGILAQVSRDRQGLMLCEGDQGHAGGWVWIGVSDAARLHEELVAKGAAIRVPPTNYPWAHEMQVQDPDGNVLRFGSEPLKGVPTGPWRDMRGALWEPLPAGGWARAAGG